jgi:hypothetical protein
VAFARQIEACARRFAGMTGSRLQDAQDGNLGRNDREFLRQKANAGSEDGNGGDEVQGTVIIGQSYAIRSLLSAICMRSFRRKVRSIF